MVSLDSSSLLRVLATISAVSGAAFGMLGIATESRRGNKLTAFGWISMLGVILSTAFSISTESIRARNDKHNEDERQRIESIRFSTQLGQLLGLGERMKESSLMLQENLESVDRVRIEQKGATNRLLLGLWKDSNRVRNNGVTLISTIECTNLPTSQFPDLFNSGTYAGVGVEEEVRFNREHRDRRELNPDGVIIGHGAMGLSLASPKLFDLGWSKYDSPTGPTYHVDKAIHFTETTGNIGDLGDIDRWRNKLIEVIIISKSNKFSSEELHKTFKYNSNDVSHLSEYYHLPKLERGQAIEALPCRAELSLSLNGREVAVGTAIVTRWVDPNNSETDGFLFIAFPVTKVIASGLPPVNIGRR